MTPGTSNARRLRRIAAAIHREEQLGTANPEAAARSRVRIGSLLRKAQGLLGADRWADWVRDATGLSQRRANRYLRETAAAPNAPDRAAAVRVRPAPALTVSPTPAAPAVVAKPPPRPMPSPAALAELAAQAEALGTDPERLRACIHEAAHAVIGYRVGLRVGRWGVQVGSLDSPRQHAFAYSETPAGGAPCARRATAAQIAGPLCEAAYLGLTITDPELLFAAAEARVDSAARTDHAAIFARFLASDPGATDGHLLAAYRTAEAEVRTLLREPATTRSVAALARALVRHQRLSADAVEKILEPSVLVAAPAFAVSLADVFERDVPVFLGFSGGRDSIVLADLCQPWRERVTLLWVNTGLMAPHMVDFVRGYRERGWNLIEIAPHDLPAFWRDCGIPADVTSASHAMGWEGQPYQLWTACCFTNRQLPVNQFLAAQEPCIYLTGQRRDDRGGTPQGIASTLPDFVDVVMPLWDWDADRVQACVDHGLLALPPQYADGFEDSIECVSCPAGLRPERMRYLNAHFPETAERLRPVVRRALAEAERRIAEVRAVTGA